MKSYLTRPQVRKNVSLVVVFCSSPSVKLVKYKLRREKQPAADSRTQVATKIPDRLPVRIADGTNKEVLVMTLGDIKTPLGRRYFLPGRR